jgi:hypothetical protein
VYSSPAAMLLAGRFRGIGALARCVAIMGYERGRRGRGMCMVANVLPWAVLSPCVREGHAIASIPDGCHALLPPTGGPGGSTPRIPEEILYCLSSLHESGVLHRVRNVTIITLCMQT